MAAAVEGTRARMRDLLRASAAGGGAAVIGAAWGAGPYRNSGVGRLRLILFGVPAGGLDGPDGGVVPGRAGGPAG
ncbi:twin-arginine translocation signal domain-containing protein [Streptomyces vinaceus]|uniref:Twin-arginine translocation signal domain-containing protein n=1 Tax=Streptomyces vinaceus TaxID=1960 RepID=A0A5J6JGH6_STRVI|nr:twin-arginine translocation signal domain-containing protein [Streptomyces vinaceus]GHE73098.1 hypothetical protein GCM10017778_67990 [Streptomyces vinaceus]